MKVPSLPPLFSGRWARAPLHSLLHELPHALPHALLHELPHALLPGRIALGALLALALTWPQQAHSQTPDERAWPNAPAQSPTNSTTLATPTPTTPTPATPPPPPTPQAPQHSSHVSEEQAMMWFNMLDTNHDGCISRQEAAVAILVAPRLAKFFDEADMRHDGCITPDEIRALVQRKRAEREAARAAKGQQPAGAPPGLPQPPNGAAGP